MGYGIAVLNTSIVTHRDNASVLDHDCADWEPTLVVGLQGLSEGFSHEPLMIYVCQSHGSGGQPTTSFGYGKFCLGWFAAAAWCSVASSPPTK
jgi:hypothetical protein